MTTSSTIHRRLRSAAAALALGGLAGCGPTGGGPAAPAGGPAGPPGGEGGGELGAAPEGVIGEVTVTPIVHGSLRLRFRDRNLFVDPWSEGSYEGLGKADMILITDVHRDHLDRAAIDALRTDATVIVAPPAVAEQLEGLAVTVIASGERREVAGIEVEAVAMYNLVRGPEEGKRYHDKGRGNGYVLTLGATRVYISGDTECTEEMRALRDIDVAFVCMNLPYTMPPSEAAACIRAFRPTIVYPYHHRGSDLGELTRALAGEAGIEARIVDWYPGGAGR